MNIIEQMYRDHTHHVQLHQHADHKIELLASNAVVRIRHQERESCLVQTSDPMQWEVENGVIRQISPADQFSERVPQLIEIAIPASYRACWLDLTLKGSSSLQLDYWRGGGVKLRHSGWGDVHMHSLTDLSTAIITNDGFGGCINIHTLYTKAFITNLNGSGRLDVDNFWAENLLMTQTGLEHVTIFNGSAESGAVFNAGLGSTTLRGQFTAIQTYMADSALVRVLNPML